MQLTLVHFMTFLKVFTIMCYLALTEDILLIIKYWLLSGEQIKLSEIKLILKSQWLWE